MKYMIQENKELLLKDLCMRLPYEVKFLGESWNYEWDQKISVIEVLEDIDKDGYINDTKVYTVEDIKPYLRPLSSMTDEEENAYYKTWCDPLFDLATRQHTKEEEPIMFAKAHYDSIVFLLENHFDFLGLIPLGLAIEVTEKNNPYKQ